MSSFSGHAGPYALGTFRAGRREFAALVVRERILPITDVAGLHHPTVRDLLEHWMAVQPELVSWATDHRADEFDAASVAVLAPVESRQIFQCGDNYRDPQRRPQQDERPEAGEPHVFAAAVSAVCGAYDDVVLPAGTAQNDVELELAAVIGTPARRVSPADALSHVMGYTIVNDITSRDRVRRPELPYGGADWFRSKNAPTFLPTGPYIVPAAFIGDPMDLRITVRLNGQVVQNAATKDMIFDVARLVSYCSQIATLLPGDLVLTGSPACHGLHRPLRPGDVVDSEITGLGQQRNGCVAEHFPSPLTTSGASA